MCRASGLRLTYSWERSSSGSSWTTVSKDNTTLYTTNTTLTSGQYKYRCRVSNEAGSVVSNSATVNVYGECCINEIYVTGFREIVLNYSLKVTKYSILNILSYNQPSIVSTQIKLTQ